MNELHDAVLVLFIFAVLLVAGLLDRDNQRLASDLAALQGARDDWRTAIIAMEKRIRWTESELGHSADAVDEVKQ